MTGSSPPDIIVTEDVTGPAMVPLAEKFEVYQDPTLWQRPDELADTVRNVRAVIVRNRTQVTAQLLRAAEHVLIVGRAGAGLDNVDVQAASNLGIVVCSAPVQNATSVAEHTLALMLSLARRIPPADCSVRQGQWLRHEHTGVQLAGKILGVIGLGNIGRRVATYGRALGMQVIAHDPYLSPDSEAVAQLGCELMSLSELFAQADVVTVHVPLTDATHHLLNRQAFEQMKDSALLINTSRGPVVNEADLGEALTSGAIAGAALDVRETEPPDPDSPLHMLDNVVLTPHIAAFTTAAQNAVIEAVVADVTAVLDGQAASYYANFPRPQR